jgi:meiotic recombination protein SPO11
LKTSDIYYRDPALFGRQSHVDKYVDDIAHAFGVPRSSLHVIAAAKGLITGAVNFCRRDGTTVQASSDREGLLMPSLKDILSASMTSVRWVLVVEKEATFRSIAASDFWEALSANGIMVTAKGYPDVSTRAMLRFLSSPAPQNGFCAPPVYALVDCDPDGVGILSTYKHGSKNLAHETSHLRLPQLQWLGLRNEQIMNSHEKHNNQGLLTLSTRDRNKARKMLEWDAMADDEDLRRELQVMLMLNVKAELQLLDAVADGMSSLLKSNLPI